MAKTPVLVACVVSRSLYVRLRDYGRGRYVTRAITVRELADQLHLSEASNGATVFLWEIDGNTTDEIVAAMDRGGASLRRAALLVLLPIGAVKARQVVMLVSRLPDAEVLLDGFDDVLQAVHRGVDGGRVRPPCQQMIGALVASEPATVSGILPNAMH